MRVYSVLKPTEGRLKKAPGRVVAAQKRKINQISADPTASIPTKTALPSVTVAAPNNELNNFDQDLDLFKRGCANKAQKFGHAWLKAMIKAQREEGLLPPEN